jgi:hypothetical protein
VLQRHCQPLSRLGQLLCLLWLLVLLLQELRA